MRMDDFDKGDTVNQLLPMINIPLELFSRDGLTKPNLKGFNVTKHKMQSFYLSDEAPPETYYLRPK